MNDTNRRALWDQSRTSQRILAGPHRALFSITAKTVQALAIETGYPNRFLLHENYEEAPDRDDQLAYLNLCPDQPGATSSGMGKELRALFDHAKLS